MARRSGHLSASPRDGRIVSNQERETQAGAVLSVPRKEEFYRGGPRQAGFPPVEPGFRSLKLRNMDDVVSKQTFAELIGVTPPRRRPYLAEGRRGREAAGRAGARPATNDRQRRRCC